MSVSVDSEFISNFLKEEGLELTDYKEKETNIIRLHEFTLEENRDTYMVWTTKLHKNREIFLKNIIESRTTNDLIVQKLKEAISETPENKWDNIFEPINFKIEDVEEVKKNESELKTELEKIFDEKIIPLFEEGNRNEQLSNNFEKWLYGLEFVGSRYEQIIVNLMEKLSNLLNYEKKGNRIVFIFGDENNSIIEQKEKLLQLQKDFTFFGLNPKIVLSVN